MSKNTSPSSSQTSRASRVAAIRSLVAVHLDITATSELQRAVSSDPGTVYGHCGSKAAQPTGQPDGAAKDRDRERHRTARSASRQPCSSRQNAALCVIEVSSHDCSASSCSTVHVGSSPTGQPWRCGLLDCRGWRLRDRNGHRRSPFALRGVEIRLTRPLPPSIASAIARRPRTSRCSIASMPTPTLSAASQDESPSILRS